MVGTSFSAPLASGVAALVLSIQPGLSGAAVSSLLVGHVRPHTRQANLATCSAQAISQGACNCTTQTCGSGLLDVDLAQAAAQSSLPTAPVTPPLRLHLSNAVHEFRGWRWRSWWPVGCRVVAVVVGCTPQPDQEQACSVLPLRTSGGMSSVKRLKRSLQSVSGLGQLEGVERGLGPFNDDFGPFDACPWSHRAVPVVRLLRWSRCPWPGQVAGWGLTRPENPLAAV
jgi:hypothetical protein